MSATEAEKSVLLLRHGLTFQNGDAFFYGSGQDGIVIEGRPQPDLTDTGKRQAQAAALVCNALGYDIRSVVTSTLNRTSQTLDQFAQYYNGVLQRAPSEPGLGEVFHGSLELASPAVTRAYAESFRARTVPAMAQVLVRNGVEHEVARKHAGWVAPLGRGDGEGYVQTSLRVAEVFDRAGRLPNPIIVGHHGSLRQGMALAIMLTKAQRDQLISHAESLHIAQQEAADAVRSFRTKHWRELSTEELAAAFAPFGRAACAVVTQMYEMQLPSMESVYVAYPKLGNGQLLKCQITASGRWQPEHIIMTELPEGDITLTAANVRHTYKPYL